MSSKIEVEISLKDRFSNVLGHIKSKTNSSISEMKNKINSIKGSFSDAFSGLKQEIPILGRSMELLTNKWILMGTGIVSAGLLLKSATKSASDFNSEFLHIKNLNLEKSESVLNEYKKTIKDTAFSVGLDLNKTTQAFYDVQSATGFFGKDVQNVVDQVGKFSIATGADLNDSINATTKALKAFGLGAKDTKMLLESNAKTVQVGITTFSELARVQTEYAGAAAGAGQSVDVANKLFSAFTSIAKDSNTAATMTKTAFQGLAQKQTIDGLKSIEVQMYDTKENMRDLTDVLGEISQKFKGMSSQQVDTLINKIGGPEGLRNMFVKLKVGADDFFGTLDAFDKSKFDMDKALKNAHGDFNKLTEIVKNRWGVVMTNIGEKILPLISKGLNAINNTILWFNELSSSSKNIISGVGTILGVLVGTTFLFNKALLITGITGAGFTGILGSIKIGLIAIRTAFFNIPIIGWVAAAVTGLVILYQKWDAFRNVVDRVWQVIKAFFINMWNGLKNIGKGLLDIFSGNFKEGLTKMAKGTMDFIPVTNAIKNGKQYREEFNKGFEISKIKNIKNKENSDNSIFDVTSNNKINNFNPTNSSPTEQVSKIVGSASQIRNISIHFDNLNNGDVHINQADSFDAKEKDDVSRQWAEFLLRVVKLSEQGLIS